MPLHNLDTAAKQMFAGNILLVVCCAFYLSWWLLAFKPVGAVKGIRTGWLLLPASASGLASVFLTLRGVGTASQTGGFFPATYLLWGGIAAYTVLWITTFLLLKRPVTSELFLIVGWAALAVAEVNALYGAGFFSHGVSYAFLAVIFTVTVLCLVCYVLFYHLNVRARYLDGAVPLLLTLFVTVGISMLLLVSGRSLAPEVEVPSGDQAETVAFSEQDEEENAKGRDYYGELIEAVREYILKNRYGKVTEHYEFSEGAMGTSLGYVIQCSLKKDGKILANYDFSTAMTTFRSDEILGYLIKDIDGDGTKELIFGENKIEPNETWDGMIYDIYTLTSKARPPEGRELRDAFGCPISDGELVHVLNGWERNRYYLCENGMIANEGSSGAANSNYSYFIFEGSKLRLVESVLYDGMKDAGHPWFYSTESEFDAENAEPISEERAMEIRGKYVYEHPTFLPFVEER